SLFFNTHAVFPAVNYHWSLHNVWVYLLLGVLCALCSWAIIRSDNVISKAASKIRNEWLRALAGCLILGLVLPFLPALSGQGYDFVSSLLQATPEAIPNGIFPDSTAGNSAMLLVMMIILTLLKPAISMISLKSGGDGGMFGPSLTTGAFLGYAFSLFLHSIGITDVSPISCVAAGMAGVLAGVMHAPLTGIFLIAELTGGYSFFLPLMIVAVASFLTIILFEKHSIYSMRLAQKGQLLTHHKDKAVLTLMRVENVIETDFDTVDQDMTLGDLVKVISKAHRNVFPVVDKDGIFLGLVYLDDIRNIMFRQELYQRFKVRRLMISPSAILKVSDSMEQVMRTFDDTNAWNLPVTDEENRYVGFVSKSKIFNSYRKVLVHFSDE
ncbi:MAG: chloride channel protein, partial [Bacteroidales bacterium]|nr:chloride channel protein [Bacteroidales bacterium]